MYSKAEPVEDSSYPSNSGSSSSESEPLDKMPATHPVFKLTQTNLDELRAVLASAAFARADWTTAALDEAPAAAEPRLHLGYA